MPLSSISQFIPSPIAQISIKEAELLSKKLSAQKLAKLTGGEIALFDTRAARHHSTFDIPAELGILHPSESPRTTDRWHGPGTYFWHNPDESLKAS